MSWSFNGSSMLGVNTNSPSMPTSVSIAAWIYPTSAATQVVLHWRNSASGSRRALLRVEADNTVLAVLRDETTNQKLTQSTGTVTLNAWNLIGLTFNGSSGSNDLFGYIGATSFHATGDTFADLSGTCDAIAVGGDVVAGPGYGGNEFIGQIAYPTIWNVALTAGDFTSLLTQVPSVVGSGSLIRAWAPDSYVDTIGATQTFSEVEGDVTNSGNNPSFGGGSVRRMLMLGIGR